MAPANQTSNDNIAEAINGLAAAIKEGLAAIANTLGDPHWAERALALVGVLTLVWLVWKEGVAANPSVRA
ncbi:hypothetical protein QBC46DRAFT_347774 [Diplogelasinospora grovesii]|uniref:Uncharacterized protein n=1 Tax=Diplogelasinospora grovesii TaxID=303347 RepID=A0AAN6MWR7_9PEZI|nr:hypothetical protein QBC46DRAFT_347774 [Diplogelasinospora grovesii]